MPDDRMSDPEVGSERLFLAVEIPTEAKSAIVAAIEPLREAFPSARWLPAENWHVTLKFLGPTPETLVTWIERTVREVTGGHAPALASVRNLGAFPSTGRARVVWAGIDDPTGALTRLAAGLAASLAVEFRVDVRAFTPHVTVARPEPPIRLTEAIAEAPTLSTEAFPIDRVVLFRSHLGRPAPRYEPLATFPLTG